MSAKIEVWQASLHRESGDEALLSAAERARAARFRREQDRNRFVGSRTLLRRALARKTGLTPEALDIQIASNGKPFLANAPVHFSISHSANLLLVAISPKAEVGIDIEWMDPKVDFLSVAARNFTREQYTALREARQGPERMCLFYRLWTAREALLKAWGCGCVGTVPPEVCAEIRVSPLSAPSGFRAALAVYAPAAAGCLDFGFTPEYHLGSHW